MKPSDQPSILDMPLDAITGDRLRHATRDELSDLFKKLPPPEKHEFNHRMRGTVINGNAVWRYSAGLKLTNFFWKGKTFSIQQEKGKNRLRFFGIPLTLFTFKTAIEPSMFYDGLVLTLKYQYPFSLNPWPVRAIVDEMRRVKPGLHIGTGNVKLLNRFYLFDWYILEPFDAG